MSVADALRQALETKIIRRRAIKRDLRSFARAMEGAPVKLQHEIRTIVWTRLSQALREIVAETPVDTHRMEGSWRLDMLDKGPGALFTMDIVNTAPYAGWVAKRGMINYKTMTPAMREALRFKNYNLPPILERAEADIVEQIREAMRVVLTEKLAQGLRVRGVRVPSRAERAAIRAAGGG